MAKKHWPEIIYEDREIIVINKPAGLLSIATEAQRDATAWRQVTDYLQIRNKRARAFIVHRLDRDTSGVLLFAKNEEIKLALQEKWNEIVTCRGYTAVVSGEPPKAEDTITSYLLENKAHIVYSAPKSKGGKEAITCYRKRNSRKGFSLLDLEIKTGRKNQIRVHMKEAGCPVVGDRKYGDGANPLRRLGLHAGKLELRHPITGVPMSFEAPMPVEFTRLFPQKPAKETEEL